jgi:hypothetical protein
MKRIEVLVFDACPNTHAAVERARVAVALAGVPAEITVVHVESEEEVTHWRFLGSPSVRVDGVDVDPTAVARDFGMQCRLYAVEGRREGVPPVHWIVAALRGDPAQTPLNLPASACSACICEPSAAASNPPDNGEDLA